MSTERNATMEDIASISPDEMTKGQREMLISCLAKCDSENFINNQYATACDSISNIQARQNDFDKRGEKYAESEFAIYMKQHPKQKIDSKIIERFGNLAEKQSDVYRKRYACQLLGLGNGAFNYCIALQRNACLKANDTLGYNIMPDIGLSCANARTLFNAQNVGHYYSQISDCYNTNTQIVKCDKNGNPKLRNGDLLLVVDPKDNHAYHCVRINVDKRGMVSYTAGNGEKISGRLGWMKNQACYVIPTEEITLKNAQKHYTEMSNEQLLAVAREKGLFGTQQAIQDKQQTINTMQSDYQRFLQCFRAIEQTCFTLNNNVNPQEIATENRQNTAFNRQNILNSQSQYN